MTVRTLTCPVPENINPLSPNGYLFSIQKLPQLTYFCQQVSLPSVNLPGSEFSTSMVNIPSIGEKLEYTDLTVEFMVDSKMENFKAIYRWLKGLGFPESNYDYTNFISTDSLPSDEYSKMLSDATLTILDNNNNQTAVVEFVDCFPVSLESLQFVSNSDDVQYLIGNCTFKYTLYRFL